jgi:dimethylamine monooxygenase subunit C
MQISGIKSRPVYKGLALDEKARRHIICAEAEGAETVVNLLSGAASDILARTEVLYVPRSVADRNHAEQLRALSPDVLTEAPTIATLLVRLDGLLANAVMGQRLSIVGTEGFIGECMQVALRHGVDQASIRTEHRGSEKRRVQCVHCKGITEDVTTQPARCSHCGLMLLVRDHYSHRIGAFQGVCIDAEEPGDLPETVVAFP